MIRTRLARLVALCALLASTAVLAAPSADAYVHGDCKYAGTNPTIRYYFSGVSSSYQQIFNNAQWRWDSTSAPGYFTPTSSGSNRNIKVMDLWSTSTSLAWTAGGCDAGPGFGTWWNNRVDIVFNTRAMDGRSWDRNVQTAVHELGHAYGLAHSTLGCSSPVVMRSPSSWAYDTCGAGVGPYANDVQGVQAHY